MNSPSEHTHEELLNAYLDNELDTAGEESLFARLAENTELRQQLREMRMIRAESRNYFASLVPSSEETRRVFSALNFGTPAESGGSAILPIPSNASVETVTSLGKTSLFLNSIKPFLIPIGAALVSALLTGIVIFGFFIPANQTEKQQQFPAGHSRAEKGSAASPTIVQSEQPVTVEEKSPSLIGKAAPTLSPSDRTTTNHETANRTASSTRNASKTAESATVGNNEQTPPSGNVTETREIPYKESVPPVNRGEEKHVTPSTLSGQNKESGSPAVLDNRENAKPPAATRSEEHEQLEKPLPKNMPDSAGIGAPEAAMNSMLQQPLLGRPIANMMLEVRGMNSRSNLTFDVHDEGSRLKNSSVGLFYKLDAQNAIGLEIGLETFAQEYSGVFDSGGVEYRRTWQQNLMTPWLAVTYRHQFLGLSLIRGVSPFVSLSGGVTREAWPLSKAIVGLQISPVERITFLIGAEGTLMAYPFQSRWFASSKYGFSYGCNISF